MKRFFDLRLIIAIVAMIIICLCFHAAGKSMTLEPKLTLKGQPTVQLTVGETFDDPGATAELGGKNITSSIQTVTKLNTDKVGKYTIQYVVSRFKHDYSVSRTVTVTDKEPPVIKLKGDSKMTIKLNQKYEDPGYTATDDSDGNITKKVKVSGYVDPTLSGTYKLTYSVSDTSGNSTSVTREVTVSTEAVKTEDSTIYLTFDDGPSTEVTPSILKTLKENNIKATFFIINYKNDEEDLTSLVKQELSEGHTVGIHSYTHDYAKIYTSTTAFWSDFNKLYNQLYKDTGYKAFVSRFPGGSSNTVSRHYCQGIMTTLAKEVTEKGFNYMDWNVDSTDAQGNERPVSTLVENVESELQKNRNNVVLMHDTNAKKTTAKALPQIIKYGKEHGYTFKAMTKDMVPVHQPVNN